MLLQALLAPSSTGFALGALGVGVLVATTSAAHLVRRHSRREASEHIVRLAGEIVAIARTVASDLAHIGPNTPFARFDQQAAEYARRAGNAIAARDRLRRRRSQVLEATLVLLHEDHRHMVDLRSEFDAALALWANCHPRERSAAAAAPPGGTGAPLPRNSAPLP
jgi:hypothetical protein